MIYLFTENIFLKQGVNAALYPLLVETVTVDEYDRCAAESMMEGDVLMIDPHLAFNTVLQMVSRYSHDLKIVFLNSDKFREVNFRMLYSSSWVLNSRLSLTNFRTGFLKILAGKNQPLSCRTLLSIKERYVLLASMKGLSAQDIAKESGIKVKTIYHNRKSACRKLGIDKVWEIVPYSHSFNSQL